MARAAPMSAVIQGNFPGGRPSFAQAATGAVVQRAPSGLAGPAPHVAAAVGRARGGPAVAAPVGQARAALRPPPAKSAPTPAGPAYSVPQGLLDLGSVGPGRALPAAVQRQMESALAADFSDVRIHVGREAAALGARAFTVGSQIFFAPGEYQPQTRHGQRLLGHELTHVVQQRAGRVRNPFGSGLAVVQDPGLEAEAERMGLRAAAGFAPAWQVQAPPTAGRPAALQPCPRGGVLRPGALQMVRAAILPHAAGNGGLEELGQVVALAASVKEQMEEVDERKEPEVLKEIKGRLHEFQQSNSWATKLLNKRKPKLPRDFANRLEQFDDVTRHLMDRLNDSYQRHGSLYGGNSEVDDDPQQGFIGVPPSLWSLIPSQKYASFPEYIHRKTEKQLGGDLEPVPYELVRRDFRKVKGGPQNVKVILELNRSNPFKVSAKSIGDEMRGSQLFLKSRARFSLPQGSHNHEEYTTSKDDGEVDVLAAALIHCFRDLKDGDGTCSHLLALIGPFGPCDGCKGRIKTFKAAWRELAQKAGRNGTLTITYFFRHPSGLFRNETTLYGYHEAQRGDDSRLPGLGPISGSTAEEGVYYHRTHQTRFPKN